tara:strand:- start:4306 stop:5370 length:1065 start_codon:yes stop_codon:yes gene_type:complete
MALNTTTSLSGQYQNYFSKKLLTYAVQALVLDQFAEKAPLPAKSGHHTISMFRFDTPSTGAIETLGTEGTAPTGTRTLTLTKISKALIQRGQIIKLTDVLNATDLFNSLAQSIKINGQDAALDMDTQTRNTLVGSNVAGTAKENGDGSALDNSDTLSEMYADGGTDYSTFDAVTGATSVLAASSILDAVTKLKVNRAQPAKGGMYVAATSPQVLSDVMKVNEWLNAAQYSNVQELYKGEVGSLYGAKFIMHTNGWSSVYASADDDRFAYSVGGTGTRAAGANIRATLFLGEQAFGVPELASQSPFSPKVIITDTADKTDPLNQLTTAGFKVFWTTLRLNPNYYVIMRSKTDSTA